MESAPVVPKANEGEKIHTDVLLFNRLSYDEVQISDMSVDDYITTTAAKHPTYMPHTTGRPCDLTKATFDEALMDIDNLEVDEAFKESLNLIQQIRDKHVVLEL